MCTVLLPPGVNPIAVNNIYQNQHFLRTLDAKLRYLPLSLLSVSNLWSWANNPPTNNRGYPYTAFTTALQPHASSKHCVTYCLEAVTTLLSGSPLSVRCLEWVTPHFPVIYWENVYLYILYKPQLPSLCYYTVYVATTRLAGSGKYLVVLSGDVGLRGGAVCWGRF